MAVCGGIGSLTGRRIQLRETVETRDTRREAVRVRTRLQNRVDEYRTPRTEATVDGLLGRWLEALDGQRRRCRDHCRGRKHVQRFRRAAAAARRRAPVDAQVAFAALRATPEVASWSGEPIDPADPDGAVRGLDGCGLAT